MSDKPRLTPTGSHEVGYGKPPKESQFKKGRSGNPRGRPKGAKNREPVAFERLKGILIKEAYREVDIQDRTGPVTVTMAQAAIRSLAVKAAKGQIGAQKLLLTSLSAVESEEKRELLKAYDNARDYKKSKRAIFQSYRDRGQEPPEILPHPDDIEINLETGKVIFHGPVSPDDKAVWNQLHDHKANSEEEIKNYKAEIKALEAGEPDAVENEEFDENYTVEDSIAALKRDLEFEQFILITTCLSIMRRWSLPGKKVTYNFVLRSLLDQHFANGTDPKRPKSSKSKRIDWEKAYKEMR